MDMLAHQQLLREIAYVEKLVTGRRRDLDRQLDDPRIREKLQRAQTRLVELNAKLRR